MGYFGGPSGGGKSAGTAGTAGTAGVFVTIGIKEVGFMFGSAFIGEMVNTGIDISSYFSFCEVNPQLIGLTIFPAFFLVEILYQ
jgi:hypothetical protein